MLIKDKKEMTKLGSILYNFEVIYRNIVHFLKQGCNVVADTMSDNGSFPYSFSKNGLITTTLLI